MPTSINPIHNPRTHQVLLALALALAMQLTPFAAALGQIPTATTPRKARPNLKMHLKKWFQKLQKRIKKLQASIATADKAKRFGLIMKLAEEYERIIRVHVLLAKRYNTYRNSAVWHKLQPMQRQATKQSMLFRVQAAQLYQMLLSQYPGDPRLCKAYHGLGKHLIRLGKRKVAAQIYQSLLSAFAKKPCAHKADAYLALGEGFFAKNAMKQALAQYQKVLAQGQTKSRAFALYKMAWCYYNLQEYTKSLGHFVETIQYLQKAPASAQPAPAAAQALRKRTRRDMLLPYAQVGVARTAPGFFQRVEPLHAQNMLHLLAGIYKTQGKHKRAIALYRSFVDKARTATEALQSLRQVLTLQKQLSGDKETLQHARVLKQLLRTHKATKTNARFEQEANKLIVLFVKWGMSQHKQKQYKAALAWYNHAALLLDRRGSGLWFWRGEVHMALRRFGDAAGDYEQYLRTLPKGKHAKDAAYNAVLAHDLGLQKWGPKQKKILMPAALRLISPNVHMGGFFRAAEHFLQQHPGDPRAHTIRFRYVFHAHHFGNIKDSMAMFKKMMLRKPKHPYNSHAAVLIVRLLHAYKRPKRLQTWRAGLKGQLGAPVVLARITAELRRLQATKQATSRPQPASRPASRPSSRPTP